MAPAFLSRPGSWYSQATLRQETGGCESFTPSGPLEESHLGQADSSSSPRGELATLADVLVGRRS